MSYFSKVTGWRPATLLRQGSVTDVFLRICKKFSEDFLQNICGQLFRKHRSLFHFPWNYFILTFDWWNYICTLNKYHDKNIAAHVHIQSNQKLPEIYMLSLIPLCTNLATERVSEWVYFAITKNNIMLSIVYNYNILLPGMWIN